MVGNYDTKIYILCYKMLVLLKFSKGSPKKYFLSGEVIKRGGGVKGPTNKEKINKNSELKVKNIFERFTALIKKK